MAQTEQKTQAQPKDEKGSFSGVVLNGRADPREVVKDAKNKSEAIRSLAAQNYTVSEIVRLSREIRILQYVRPNGDREMIKYQHVRNVLFQNVAAKAS